MPVKDGDGFGAEGTGEGLIVRIRTLPSRRLVVTYRGFYVADVPLRETIRAHTFQRVVVRYMRDGLWVRYGPQVLVSGVVIGGWSPRRTWRFAFGTSPPPHHLPTTSLHLLSHLHPSPLINLNPHPHRCFYRRGRPPDRPAQRRQRADPPRTSRRRGRSCKPRGGPLRCQLSVLRVGLSLTRPLTSIPSGGPQRSAVHSQGLRVHIPAATGPLVCLPRIGARGGRHECNRHR